MHDQRAVVFDFYLDYRRHVGDEAVMHRQAQASTLRQLTAPTGGFGGGFQHSAQAPGVDRIALGRFAVVPLFTQGTRIDLPIRAEQFDLVLERVLPGLVRQLIDEALDREAVGNVRHRAIPANAGVHRRFRVFQANVGNRVGHVGEAHAQLESRLVIHARREQRGDARRHRAVQPTGRQAILVQAGLEVFRRHGVEVGTMDVVFTGPLHPHRFAREFLGENGRLDDEVRLGLATETAAQQRHVERDVIERQTEALTDSCAGDLRRLARPPGFAHAVLVAGDGDHWFHRRLRQVRQVVGGFQRTVGAAHDFVDVAGVAHHFAGLEGRSLQFLAVGDRVVAGIGAVIPLDFQCLTALDRRPGIVRHHGNAAQRLKLRRQRTTLDLHNLDHAGDFHRRNRIEGFDFAAVDRRPGNGGEQHAVEMHIGAVHRATVDDVVTVDGLGAFLADVAEFRRLLELQAVTRRNSQGTGSSGQRAIFQFATGRFVDDFVQLRMAFADRDFPLIGSGLLQHGPRGGTAAAHRLVPVAHAARAVGVLVAEAHFVTRCLLHLDPCPIGFQLIGYDHGQAGTHALAHFRTVAHHGYRAVGRNADVHLGIIDPTMGHSVGAELLLFFGKRLLPAPARGNHQGTGSAHTFKKTTATEVAQGEIIR
ncbi:hypothetical protein D3C86_1183770 [compost metagenome]